MSHTIIGLCTLQFYLPGVSSLKEKRGILKSMLAKLGNKFNISVAEVNHQDKWQSAEIAIVCVSNATVHAHQTLNQVIQWIEEHHPDALITHQEIEIL